MKVLLSLFFTFVVISSYSQNIAVEGTYEFKLDTSNAVIEDTLILNADGTFTFHEYDKHEGGVPPERNTFGKGKWKLENQIVTFLVSESDIDEKHTLNFDNSEARFIMKSPRDKSNKVVPTSLKFFKSDVFWIVKRDFIKK